MIHIDVNSSKYKYQFWMRELPQPATELFHTHTHTGKQLNVQSNENDWKDEQNNRAADWKFSV